MSPLYPDILTLLTTVYKPLLIALSANARAALCLGEYAEIKWSLLSVVNHRRGRMSPEVSPEHAVCQDEEAC